MDNRLVKHSPPTQPIQRLSLIGRIGSAFKNFGMRFTGVDGGMYNVNWEYRFQSAWARLFANTRIDYQREVGDLTQSSIVMAAVNWLARALPEAPLHVVRLKSDGTEEVLPGHAAAVAWSKPNPYFSGSTLWKFYALSWITNGNPYFLKVRNGMGQVIQLWPLPDWMLQPRWPSDGTIFISHYDYYVDGQIFPIPVEDVLHFRDGIDPINQRRGLSPVASVLREIYSDNECANYAALLLKNSGVPPFIISPKESTGGLSMDPTYLKEEFMRRTTGDERGKPLFNNVAIDVHKMAFDPTELDLKMLRRLPEERLAAVIGIPAIVLGLGAGIDSSTYNNTEAADERAYRNYLVPLYRYVEDELNLQWLPEFDDSPDISMRFDLSKLAALQEDQNDLVTRMVALFNGRLIKRGEGRTACGFVAAPEDDVYDAPAAPKQVFHVNGNGTPGATDDGTKPKQLKGANGDAIAWTEKDLEALAEISDSDVDAARKTWRRYAPEAGRELFDAEVVT